MSADVRTNNTPPAATGIARWQTPALMVGIVGAIASAIGGFLQPDVFFKAYLPSYLFWFLIVAGALGVLMLQYITGGEWGLLIRRPLGAAARTMPWMFVLFLPILLGAKFIYPWLDPHFVEANPVLKLKAAWLNYNRWAAMAVLYFVIWTFWAWRVRRLSLRFYEDRAPETDLKRRRMSAAGLLMIVLTITFASIDWMMSLEPGWYSSMYGISLTVGAGLSAFAFVTFFLTRIADTGAMRDVLKPTHFRDLGNLMLAFTMLWAYTAFSEFLLIWYGNIKEEIPYFLKREHGSWGFVAACLVLFHFFLPFTMLLMRGIKDRPKTIAIVTVIVLVMRYVDIYWLTAPAFWPEQFHFSWISAAAFLGIGGLWLYLFIGQLKGQTIIPIHETWVEEAIREGALKIHA